MRLCCCIVVIQLLVWQMSQDFFLVQFWYFPVQLDLSHYAWTFFFLFVQLSLPVHLCVLDVRLFARRRVSVAALPFDNLYLAVGGAGLFRGPDPSRAQTPTTSLTAAAAPTAAAAASARDAAPGEDAREVGRMARGVTRDRWAAEEQANHGQ